jgi:hypothetical protein
MKSLGPYARFSETMKLNIPLSCFTMLVFQARDPSNCPSANQSAIPRVIRKPDENKTGKPNYAA